MKTTPPGGWLVRSFILIALLSVFPSWGSGMQEEIDHLLAFVETTDCRFGRNGKWYEGTEALEHIRKKYDYYRKKIDTAEKFIELSATRSTMTGKPYTVVCTEGHELQSREWLLQELERYRRGE